METETETRKRLLAEFAEKVKSFPPEKERKQIIFNSFNQILFAIGSYLNDSKFTFSRYEKDEEEFIEIQSVYGTYTQSVTNDSATSFFGDTLKLLLKHCEELKNTKPAIDEYFNQA